MRHPEVPRDLLARLPPLLVPDDHHALVLEAGEAGHDRRIVAEEPVAVELEEVLEQQLAEVTRVRAAGMARELGGLPRGEAGEHLLAQTLEPLLELSDLFALGRIVECLQLGDARLKLEERLFELERLRHGPRSRRRRQSARSARPPGRERRRRRGRVSVRRPPARAGADGRRRARDRGDSRRSS